MYGHVYICLVCMQACRECTCTLREKERERERERGEKENGLVNVSVCMILQAGMHYKANN